MEYRKFNDTYVIRLNKGEEVIESLKLELTKRS